MKEKSTPSSASTGIPHEQISERARTLWLKHGKPEGRDLEHWLEAERQLRAEGGGAKTKSSEPRVKSKSSIGESSREIEADKRVDGLVARRPLDERSPKQEQL